MDAAKMRAYRMKRAKDILPRWFGEEIKDYPNGLRLVVSIQQDFLNISPWENQETFGTVSDWRSKDTKEPGERILCGDRNKVRFYDWAGAVKKAREEFTRSSPEWRNEHYPGKTVGQIATELAEREFQFLRAWCYDEWAYAGIVVTLFRAVTDDEGFYDDDSTYEEIESESVWGCEWGWKDSEEYILSEARSSAARLLSKHRRTFTTAEELVTV